MCELHGETLAYDTAGQTLVYLDQTRLPGETLVKEIFRPEEVVRALRRLEIRGAPAIGVAAAIALSVLCARSEKSDMGGFLREFRENCDALESARPTAVNLSWAVRRMKNIADEHAGGSVAELKVALQKEALKLHAEDVEACRKIGEYGAPLLQGCRAVLTHCNAGRLAAVKYGTALAPVYAAKERGHDLKVYACETRPLLQGARLTCYELVSAGIDTTLICDDTASYVMKNGLVGAVLVGCDRVAANGDTANKVGTSALAILAEHYGIPFYVCAPSSSFDKAARTGADIPIELRSGDELTELWYQKRMAPEGVGTLNPAFDVTDGELITAFVTEKGVVTPRASAPQ